MEEPKEIAKPEDHGSPDHGTTYYKAHWGAYKGNIRGMIRGLMVGAVFGLTVGALFLAIAMPLSLITLPAAAATLPFVLSSLGTFTAIGSILGSNIMGHVGNAAGNVATHKAIEEINLRYPSLPMVAADSPEPGFGHHYEVPADRDRGKIFHWRVGLTGILLGTGVGSLLGLGSVGEQILGHGGHELFHTLESALPAALEASVAIPAAIGASLGAFFGIERSVFKSIFNVTDNIFMGRLGGPSKKQLLKSRERFREESPLETSEITSLERQEEFYRLQDGYFKEAFSAGFSGNARGMLGGIIAGGLAGAAFGSLLAITLFSAGAVVPIVMTFAAVGSSMGFHTFSTSASEAALHSAVDEIFDERIHAMKQGRDITFEEADAIASSKRRGDPELTPPEAELSTEWFEPKVMLLGGLAGGVCGIFMAPLIAPFIGGLIGVTFTSSVAVTVPLMAAWGGVFGFGEKVTRGIQQLADNLFMGTLFPKEHKRVEDRNPDIPLYEHSSDLAVIHDVHCAAVAPTITVGEAQEKQSEIQVQELSAEKATQTTIPPLVELQQSLARKPETDYLRDILQEKRQRASSLFEDKLVSQRQQQSADQPLAAIL